MQLDERKANLLRAIVETYIDSAEPVSSKFLVESFNLGVSSATVRNEMAALEQLGLIRQPYTSAGRIPTEAGYSYYISHFVEPHVRTKTTERLRQSVKNVEGDDRAKHLARELVELSGDFVFVSRGPQSVYYTGLSRLFNQPDFQDLELIRGLSELIDRFDDVISDLYNNLEAQPSVMIGEQNPFGKETASILVKCRFPNGHSAVIGLVGPMRMDYSRNIGLIEEVIDILEE